MPVDPDLFRTAMARLPGGVTVLSTRWKDADHAATVSSVLSASLDPPIIVVSLHADSRIRDALDQVDTWGLSILADDQAPIADWLASPGRPVIGQLSRVPHHRAPESGAAWVDGASAWVDCRTRQIVPAGDHDLVLGDVLAVREGRSDAGALVHLRRRVHPLR
ncbi:flavin reductase family protein [Cellulomonas sp. RIT-PI-Y]|uniref:flavin reductase family protein n=1 Tax=Cellulomonas sp. RIT-PI-Y TaxID=3035297 RepID=UPI0021DA3F5C|nr:flavin reductase family protein [Cellulomonas sp. RIT-PI-Y]